MSKINDLSRCLVSRYTISQADADRFVREFFNIVKTNLEMDKIVKISGLGTFKLVESNVRETIDINTRERITVGGNRRIVFTPEPAVRNRINSPFQQFTSIEVPADSDFADIDGKYSATETANEKTVVEIPCEPEMPLDDEVETSTEMSGTKAATNEAANETQATDETQAEVETKATGKTTELPQTGVVQPVATKIHPQETTEKSGILEDLPADETREASNETIDATGESREASNESICETEEADDGAGRGIRWLKIVAALVAALVVALGCYYAYNAGWFDKIAVGQASGSAEEQAVSESSAAEILPADSLDEASKNAEKSGILEDLPASPVDDTAYDADPRVRLGAYVIIGLDTTVTVLDGQTLKGISRAFFGDGMECYVEAFNGGVTSVSAGDKLKIPKLRSKKSLQRQAAD